MSEEAELVLSEDADCVVEGIAELAEPLRGASVLVTGATGLIGTLVVCSLMRASQALSLGCRVIAAGRNAERLEDAFGAPDGEALAFCVGDVADGLVVDGNVDYIIHGASPTSSKFFVSHPVDTINAAIDGTRNILDLAIEKNVKSMVYLSSLEVYGEIFDHPGLVSESEFGSIDPMTVRSSYSEGKRLCECLCAAYASQYNVPVKVARLSQTFGAGVRYDDGRVFAEFARCALEERPITLHTQGRTTRTYCYTADAVCALLFLLLRGQNGEAYNVSNEETAISIRDMAQLVSETLSATNVPVVVDVPDDLESYGYNPEMVIKLDCSKLRALGWAPKTGLAEMFVRMSRSYTDR